MATEEDPPRKVYGFKEREFDRQNLPSGKSKDGPNDLHHLEKLARAAQPKPAWQPSPGDDVPPKSYDVKPREDFEKHNELTSVPTDEPTDVRQHLELAQGDFAGLSELKPPLKPSELHEILLENLEADKAAGRFDVKPGVDTRVVKRQRVLIGLVVMDLCLAVFGFLRRNDTSIPAGVTTAFVIGIGVLINLLVAYTVWFLRTE